MTQTAFQFEVPRSRRTDPPSSRRAADALHRNGGAASQRATSLELVKKYPGRSSKELAQLSGLDRHMIAKRLPELRYKLKVRSTQFGTEDQKWWAV